MIIPYHELQEQIGGRSVNEVIVRLNQLGIKYLVGKRGRPFTTEFALNKSMGIISNEMSRDLSRPTIEIK